MRIKTMNVKKQSNFYATFAQFAMLVDELEMIPDVARGNPSFGANRLRFKHEFDRIAVKLNAIGPPFRNTNEWRKTWTDLKARTKKKYARMARRSGGRARKGVLFSPLERKVARLLQLGKIATPSVTTAEQPTTSYIVRRPLPQDAVPPLHRIMQPPLEATEEPVKTENLQLVWLLAEPQEVAANVEIENAPLQETYEDKEEDSPQLQRQVSRDLLYHQQTYEAKEEDTPQLQRHVSRALLYHQHLDLLQQTITNQHQISEILMSISNVMAKNAETLSLLADSNQNLAKIAAEHLNLTRPPPFM